MSMKYIWFVNRKMNVKGVRRPGRSSVHLSKCLSWLLRHGATKEGIGVGADGYVYVDDILKHKSFKGYTENCIRDVVETNEKQRFALKTCPHSGRLQIKANQGHSFQVDDLQLTPIVDACEAPVVIHGTTLKNWEKIQKQGLSRMNRIHIHFTAAEPGSNEVISGFRGSSEILIYIDVEKAIADGIKFFRSSNNVILSAGDEKGFISPQYFKSIKSL